MIRRLAAVLAALALLLVPGPAPARERAAVPLRIMLAGDSLTQGHGGTAGPRRELGARLAAAGVDHEFVGSTAVGGWTVQSLAAAMPGWLATYQPDLVLISIGTNNAAGVPPGMAGFENAYIALVNLVLAWSPTVRVGVAQVLYSNAGWSPNLVYVNVGAIHAAWWDAPGHSRPAPTRVTLADFSTIHACQTWDGVHLRDSGYDQMGRQWYRALAGPMGWPALTYSDHLPVQRRPGFERPAAMAC